MKRKLFYLLVALSTLAGLVGSLPPQAVLAATLVVSIDAPYRVAVSTNFTAAVRNTRIEYLKSGIYDVVFDPTILRLDNVTSGSSDGYIIPVSNWELISPGRYRVTQDIPGSMGMTVSGSLAILHFQVVASQNGTSNINLENGTLRYYTGDVIPASWVGDSILVYKPTKVVSTIPVDGKNTVAVNSPIEIAFSGAMNRTLTETAFSITPAVTGNFSWSSDTVMVFTPDNNLHSNTRYAITLYKSALDINNNPLLENYVFSFTTATPPPSKPDLVISEKHEQWLQQDSTYRVFYTVKNIGTANASAGQDTALTVDGNLIEQKQVPALLAPGATYSDNFTTIVNLSGLSDNISVSADFNNEVDEASETNNSLLNIWSSVRVGINAQAKVAADRDFAANVEINQVQNFDAANFDVFFNPAVLRLDSVTNGSIGNVTVPIDAWNIRQPGRFSIMANVPGVTGASGNGSLAVLHFHVIGLLGQSSNITLASGILSNSQAQEIPATWLGGLVEVGLVVGDANGDGIVNAIDVTKVERIIAHLDSSTPGADANEDGNINALDITKTERIIVGLD